MRLSKDDRIIAVAPEYHSGPGWSNHTLQVVVQDVDGKLRIEWLQPREFNRELVVLFVIGSDVHLALKAALEKLRASQEEAPRARSSTRPHRRRSAPRARR